MTWKTKKYKVAGKSSTRKIEAGQLYCVIGRSQKNKIPTDHIRHDLPDGFNVNTIDT